MALTYGIESLAVINKGGGLKRQPTSTSGYYLRGDMTWAAFPTTLAPSAHVHSADDITSGTLALARIPTGTGSNQVALGNHTHLYAGSASAGGPATTALACTGNAATATKLATTRALTIGSTAKNFDGSAPISWTLAEIGAAPTDHNHSATEITLGQLALDRIPTGTGSNQVALGNHTHLYAGSSSEGGPATTALACTGNSATATKLAASVTLTIGSTGKSFDGSTSVSWSLADIGASPSTHTHDTAYLQLTGGTLTGDLTLAAGTKFKNLNTGWNSNKIPYFVSGEMVVGTITIDSFALAAHNHSTGDLTSGTLGIVRGGTGKSSLTANAILLGGTTSTGELQQMSLGTARQILASGGASAIPQWLSADEYERFSVGGTAEASATAITAKTGISEKLVFIDPGAETTPQTVSFFKAPLAANQAYGDRIVIYCCSGNETYKYIVLPNGTERFCDLIGGQYTGNIEASYGNKIELVCLPKSGAKAWYVSRIALINNN